VKTRATRAVLVFLRALVTSVEVPIQVTVEASKLVTKLERECRANGVKLTKRRRRRKQPAATESTAAEG